MGSDADASAWGIVPGGATDRRSLKLANRLMGNAEIAAGFEITGGGFQARVAAGAMVAVTGATCAVTIDGRADGMNAPLWVPAGADVLLGPPVHGIRTYLAVRGGVDVPRVLGSRAMDLVAGIGMGALAQGDELPVGTETEGEPCVDLAPTSALPDTFQLPATLGPRASWFTPEAFRLLGSAVYTVAPDSDRVGIRFTGPPLPRRTIKELPSEPAMRGAIEVPSDGRPILFLADHPTTCGYPIIAVADPGGVDLAAQTRPGQRVVFRLVAPPQI